ncbi:MAG TPA: low affinity iron permease family protein [Candidatus Eisenbacteria bacterium]|nr:low affinity iron permease family protein [Candidatus Eisenbacteria bacterium]
MDDYRDSWFGRFSRVAARYTGSSHAFMIASLVIVAWLLTGPLFHYSDTWQLVINTGTTIITFLMVFLIQNTQNRDSEAMHLKVNELVRALEGAHVALLDLEQLSIEDLDRLRDRYSELARRARADLLMGLEDTGTPATNVELPRYDSKGRERGTTPLEQAAKDIGKGPA